MILALRNQLAEWILSALEREQDEGPIRALLAFVQTADPRGVTADISADDAVALSGARGLFERTDVGLRLRADLAGDFAALRDRAFRAREAVNLCRKRCGPSPAPHDSRAARFSGGPPSSTELAWALCAAEALFNAELFFEVHEILEPLWRRAEGDLRAFLQGLVQVAVGLHHWSTGNMRGAASLFAEGNAKLRRFRPEAWGVELATFCADVERAEKAVNDRMAEREPPDVPETRLRLKIRMAATAT